MCIRDSIHIACSRGKGSRKIFLLLLCLCALITACGENSEPEELVLIDRAYLTSPDPPAVPYPIQIEEKFEIEVGELFGYENVNWDPYFPWEFSISSPEIIEGEGKVCKITEDTFTVLGVSLGSCSLKYPSINSENEGFVFLTVKVVEG